MKVLHILFYDRPLNTFPSVYNGIYLLHQHGFENYITTSGNCDEFDGLIRRHYPLNGGFLDKLKCISNIEYRFDLSIAYGPRDLELFYLSKLINPFKFKSLLYHSLEIPTAYFTDSGGKALAHRILLKLGMSQVDKLIIQDEQRLKLLLTLCPSLKNSEYFLVKNSYINTIEPLSQSLPWFDCVRRNARHLVLYTGAIERWALSLALFDELKKLDDITFLFSGWSKDGLADEAIAYCKDSLNIHFHLGIKSRSELNYMVMNSDIGLLWYNSADSNVTSMGMSSGKFHKYLSYKKPIITNRMPQLSDYIQGRGVGISSELNNISESIQYLINNYAILQNNIENNYFQECDYESQYFKVINSLS